MKCGYSREILALYVEDDLPAVEAVDKVESHVAGCTECRQYCEDLRKSQSFIKARFRRVQPESVTQETLAGIRYNVMSQIEPAAHSLGWAVRFERFLILGLRRPRYAAVAFTVVAIVSATMLGQIRYSSPQANSPAPLFAANNTLLSPAGYREWVFVGSSREHQSAANASTGMQHNTYIDPDSYRAYKRSGKLPEGTVFVLETVSAEMKREPGLLDLQVSVKDSGRFEGGWGFYEFTDSSGKLKLEAEPLPQAAGCLSCHRDRAAKL